MTTEYPYSLAQLAQILSAMDGERRNPNTKRNAAKAIERAASRLGLDSDGVFDAADGLLSGRLSNAEWLAQLRDEPSVEAEAQTDATPLELILDEDEFATEPNAAPAARRGTRPDSKQALLIAMLRRDEGATIEQIVEATGWQRHTCRGAISGTLKKKLGLDVTSGKIDGQRVYRIGD